MAISFVNNGNAAAGTTSIALPQPASPAVGNIFVAHVSNRPFGSIPTEPSGYTQQTTGTSGSVANGADTGSVRATAYIHNVTGSETGNITFGGVTSGNPTFGRMSHFSNATGLWDVAATTLTDTTETGTAVSATGSSIDIASGDMLSVCVVIKSDTPTHSSQAIAVPGCTVGAITWLSSTTTTNNDARIYLGRCSITAGSSSGAATYTATSSVSGASATAVSLVRLREVAHAEGPGPSREFDGTDDFVHVSLGSVANMTDGAWTMAAILRRISNGNFHGIFDFQSTGSARVAMEISNNNLLQISGPGTESVSPITIATPTGWVLVVVTKNAGNSIPRFHLYSYNDEQWQHEDGDAQINNDAEVLDLLQFGQWQNVDDFEGLLAMTAAVESNLGNDATIEGLGLETSIDNWATAFSAGEVWPWQQAAVTTPVESISGASDEVARTGTTVSSTGPPDFDFDLDTGTDLVADDTTHNQTVESPALTQVHVLEPDDTTHNQVADQPTLVQTHVLEPEDATHNHTAESPTLAQVHVLEPDGATHDQVADQPTITQIHILEPDDATHNQVADQPAITQVHMLEPDDSSHGQATDEPTLAQFIDLVPEDATHNQVADQPAVTQLHVLEPNNTTHNHTAESPALTQLHVLAPNDASQGQITDQPAIAQLHVLQPADASHAQLTDQVILTGQGLLSPDLVTHQQTADSPALTQTHALEPDDAIHGQIANQPTLAVTHNLLGQDATHSQTASQPAVTQVHALEPNSATHEQVAGQPMVSVPSGHLPPLFGSATVVGLAGAVVAVGASGVIFGSGLTGQAVTQPLAGSVSSGSLTGTVT